MEGTPRFDAIVEASTAAPRETIMNTNGFGKSVRYAPSRFGADRSGGTSFELFERLLADCFPKRGSPPGDALADAGDTG